MKVVRHLVYLLVFASTIGCSEYQQVLKSTDLSYKYDKAVQYYEAEEYNKAYPIFDELLSLYRGTRRAEKVYWYYANTSYEMGDYILAAYHFKNFTKTFPNSEYTAEASYMVGKSYYEESPKYSLDQTYTFKAINELQLFVNRYPDSDKLFEANRLIDEMREKLEKKSFEIAQQYYHMEDYQAAVVSFNNTLNDYPATEFREEAMFMRLESAYKLASNSIESKKLQRFIEAQTAYLEYLESYPEGEYIKDARKMYDRIESQIEFLQQEA